MPAIPGLTRAQAARSFAPRAAKYDVIVIGATEVGVTAAIAAARQGRTVLMVGQNERIGGNVGYTLTKMDLIADVSPLVITGITREFFSRVAVMNKENTEFGRWYRAGGPVKPSWAKRVFDEMVAAEKNITTILSRTLDSITKVGVRVTSVTISGVVYEAEQYIDATPTNDLAQKAGCSLSTGREGNALYGETSAGVIAPFAIGSGGTVDPYVTPGNAASGLLPGVSPRALGTPGAADPGVMTFGWRVFLTSRADEKLPWPTTAPDGYAAVNYELLARQWAANPDHYNGVGQPYPRGAALTRTFGEYSFGTVAAGAALNEYVDLNSLGYVSSNYPNAEECLEYITATPARRAAIEAKALAYLKGLFYFITQSNDPRVPANLKTEVNAYGLSKNEHTEYGGWCPNFYVREGARLVGDYVMKSSDLGVAAAVPDAIAWWCYDFDAHPVRVLNDNGVAKSEGTYSVHAARNQYGTPVPMRVLFPKAAQVTNLLCPGQPSTSRMIYIALRAIPTMMTLGEAAGFIAAEAIRSKVPVQQVNAAKVKAMINLHGLYGAYCAASANNDYNVGSNIALAEGGTGTAFAQVSTGLRFGPHLTVANVQSVAAGVDRYKRFIPNIFKAGRYRVVHIYPPTTSPSAAENPETVGIARASNVQVKITHADGVATRVHSQRYPGPGQGFDVLGDFYFGYNVSGGIAGGGGYVDINTDGTTTDGLVIAGIIALFPLDDYTKAVNV